MRAAPLVIAAILGTVVALLALRPGDDGAAPAARVPAEPAAADDRGPAPAPSGPEPGVAAGAGAPGPALPTSEALAAAVLESSPVGEAMAFRERLQAFAAEADASPGEDHAPAARALLGEVDALAAAGYVTAPEALILQLGLLRYVLPPAEYRARSEALVDEARERAAAAEREWANRRDPQLERYRAEERRIVDEAAAMQEFPGGVSRQAYLQARLAALRNEIYGN